MTSEEWALFSAEVEATFRGDLAEDREAALREHCAVLPHAAGRLAVKRMVHEGTSWMPTPAEVLSAARSACGQRRVHAWLRGYDDPDDWARDYNRAHLGDEAARARLDAAAAAAARAPALASADAPRLVA